VRQGRLLIFRKIPTSSVIGIVGAFLAVVSIYCVWFQFSSYALTGIQVNESLSESFSYSLFVSVVYICPVFVVAGIVFAVAKPGEQLIVRSSNAFLLFIAAVAASVPILRCFGSQTFSVDIFAHLQYGFWILGGSVGLLCCAWLMSLSEIGKIRGKFERIRDQIRIFLREVESEIDISVLAKKCGVNEKLLLEAINRLGDKVCKDFLIADGKIVNKLWLSKKLEERLI